MAAKPHARVRARPCQAQLLAWTLIAGVPWIAGAFAGGNARLLLWILALAVDYGAPMHGFALPRLGSTPIGDWTLAGGHLAERCQLVLLVALGESILAVGATFSGEAWSAAAVTAFALGFTGTVALWWLYCSRSWGACRTRACSPSVCSRCSPARRRAGDADRPLAA